MDVTSSIAAVNGTHLRYEVAGKGDPIVFIHGLALDHRMWDDQFETFARQFKAIRMTASGFDFNGDNGLLGSVCGPNCRFQGHLQRSGNGVEGILLRCGRAFRRKRLH
jgi:hypothetical protein